MQVDIHQDTSPPALSRLYANAPCSRMPLGLLLLVAPFGPMASSHKVPCQAGQDSPCELSCGSDRAEG